jgi:GAF domain-containing protein
MNKDELIKDGCLIDKAMIEKWQDLLDLSAQVFKVPAALIMKLHGDQIEVFLSSRTKENPYKRGEAADLGTGLYCETVIKTNGPLMVSDALSDDEWKNNPDIKLGMVSYLGLPIRLPDGSMFGTICILDRKERSHPSLYQELFKKFRDFIENELKLLCYIKKQEAAKKEIEKLNSFMMGRERRIIELKKEVDEALENSGHPPKYKI